MPGQIHRKHLHPPALAALAFTALAPINSVHADIIYLDIPDATLHYGGGGAAINFDGVGGNELVWSVLILDNFTCLCEGSAAYADGINGAQTALSNGDTIAFVAGQIIDDSHSYSGFNKLIEQWWSQCCTTPAYCEGNWCETGQMRYIGTRFLINGTYHYAWLRTQRTGNSIPTWNITIYDLAYESQPLTPIIAGQICTADTDLSGDVAVPDLLAVINAWGACAAPCPPHCTSDINRDCAVNVQDLLAVINAWGSC